MPRIDNDVRNRIDTRCHPPKQRPHLMYAHTIQIYGKGIEITSVPVRVGPAHIGHRGHNRKLSVLQKSQRLLIIQKHQPMSRLTPILVKYNRIVPPHTIATVIYLRGGLLKGGFALTDRSLVPHLLTEPKPILMTLNLLKRHNDLTIPQSLPLKHSIDKLTNLQLHQIVVFILQQINRLPLKLPLKLIHRHTIQLGLQSIQRPDKLIELLVSQRVKIKTVYSHNI